MIKVFMVSVGSDKFPLIQTYSGETEDFFLEFKEKLENSLIRKSDSSVPEQFKFLYSMNKDSLRFKSLIEFPDKTSSKVVQKYCYKALALYRSKFMSRRNKADSGIQMTPMFCKPRILAQSTSQNS